MSVTTLTRIPAGTEVRLDPVGWMTRLVETIHTWNQRHKTRRQFAEVEARILRDVGISEAQRFIEINKPFWEA